VLKIGDTDHSGSKDVWEGTEDLPCPLLERVYIRGHDHDSLLKRLVAPNLQTIDVVSESKPSKNGQEA
jgi:hypothetical protein